MQDKLNLLDAISRRMNWLGQRQRVLAQNISNADTPEYKPQDLKEGSFARMLSRRVGGVMPVTTNPMHLRGSQSSGDGRFKVGDQQRPYEVAPSGNAVVLEEQLIKVGQTQMNYQTMTNLYRKHLSMIRTALGRGG